MIKIGLTGGIGAGKSMVASVFINIGIPVFNADTEAKKAYKEESIKTKLFAAFSHEICTNGEVNFLKLANRVFSQKSELEKLNQIIHPYVLEKFDSWVNQHADSAYCIMESAILFETGYDSMFDKIIVVSAPKELCINRVILRDSVTYDMVAKRMENQIPNEIKSQQADFIIHNGNNDMIAPQVLAIHEILLSLNK